MMTYAACMLMLSAFASLTLSYGELQMKRASVSKMKDLQDGELQMKRASVSKMKEITNFSDPALMWFHEPPTWHVDKAANVLEMGPGYRGDLWKNTYYPWALQQDHFNASALLANVSFWQNATLELEFTYSPTVYYDQAGAFVLVDEGTWVKAGIEYFAVGGPHLSVVVTNNGFSDWSTRPMTWNSHSISLKLRVSKVVHDSKQGAALYIEHWDDNLNRWELARLLPVRSSEVPWRMGPMACAPSAPAHQLKVVFSKMYLGPTIESCLQC
jgi:regulation of enolase protein 1 (concanavalin A-like superfamily)